MRWLFVIVIIVHGLIHLMGSAKAFGLAELPQLSQPISRRMGTLWLVAGVTLLITAVAFIRLPREWWMIGLVAVILSQFLILSAWSDAKVGTVANVIILLGVVYGFASQGPFSLRARFDNDVAERLSRTSVASDMVSAEPAVVSAGPVVVSAADIAHLPEPVQRYLRVTGSVGLPRIHSFRASWRGRIRAAADDAWMPFTAEQFNFIDDPARYFLMHARRGVLPIVVYHAFEDGAASMQVRALSLIRVADARGQDLTRAETVTLFNDLALLAPAALLDPIIDWEPIDDASARARYTIGDVSISATLLFDLNGELRDFVSDDRLAASADGSGFKPQRFSTPVREYRSFGERRLPVHGEGRWHPAEGEFAYIELELLDFQANPGTDASALAESARVTQRNPRHVSAK